MSLDLSETLLGHTDRVWTIAWSPDGTFLASSGGDKSIRLWMESNNSWTCCSVLTKAHSKSIRRICWSPCGNYIAAASFDATTSIWKRNYHDNSWTSVVDLDGHDNEVKSVAWSTDGCFLASCGRDKTIWIWEKSTVEGDVEEEASNWDCSDIRNDHTKDVKHIVWHPHHNILVSCSYDETIKFFHKDSDEWKCFQTLTSHTSTVWSADFSSSGEYLVSCSDDKTVRIWKNHSHEKLPIIVPNSWKCVSVVQGYHSRTIYDVSWSHFSDLIASASGDNSIAIYTKTDEELFSCVAKKSQSHECDVNTVAWNHKTGLLASGSDDHSIKLWNYRTDDKGMKVLTCQDELVEIIRKMSQTRTSENLQMEAQGFDEEVHCLKKLLHLETLEGDLPGLELSSICFNDNSSVVSLTVWISDSTGCPKYKFNLLFEEKKYLLTLPRRSIKLLLVAGQLFLIEKTGDMYRVMSDGKCQFLLGHLFMFTDLKFLTKSNGCEIAFTISSDRDEKIRISNYPDTFNIERFCFGHKHFIRRLLVVNHEKFISIDIKDNVLLWNIARIKSLRPDELLIPESSLVLGESEAKKRRLLSEKSDCYKAEPSMEGRRVESIAVE